MEQQELKKLIRYDPDTGIFTWKRRKYLNGVLVGAVAGSYDAKGYRVIRLSGRTYKAHRLAWFLVHGYFPENQIDHINGDKADNRISNLREVTQSCNRQNMPAYRSNKSGYKGISYYPRNQQWVARITYQGKRYHLGYFDCLEEAAATRKAAEQCLGWCQGGQQ